MMKVLCLLGLLAVASAFEFAEEWEDWKQVDISSSVSVVPDSRIVSLHLAIVTSSS